MSFFQNGSFEALAQQSSGNIKNNTSDTNPFGLKDFSRLLDNKFGNSAFSDNLLAAPPGAKQKDINPFGSSGTWEKPNLNDYYKDKNNPYSVKQKDKTKDKDKEDSPNGHSKAYNSAPTSLFSCGFNKGTGMSGNDTIKHKLDFCY